MGTNVGVQQAPRRVAHPRTGQVLEVALVLAIGLAAIGVLATLQGSPATTSEVGLAATQARVNATSLAWRSYKEIQASTVDARILPSAPAVAGSFDAPGTGTDPLAWRSFKEMTAGVTVLESVAVATASFETPGPGAGPLAWRSFKEMTAGE